MFDLEEASMGIKFYLHYDTIEQMVFVSMPAEKLVIKIEPQSLAITLVAGDSKTCRGNLQCGDGEKAKQARLSYPKVNTNRKFFLRSLGSRKKVFSTSCREW